MPTPAATVTVVIVNFNGGDHVLRCLRCLASQTWLPQRIIVIDNASSDRSLAACRQLIGTDERLATRTSIEESAANLGFAAAANRGIALADTDLVALLNPDAFPEPHWLEALLAAAVAHSDVAAFGSRQMLAEHEGVLDGIGDRWHLSGLAWREGHGRPLEPADLKPREIFSPCAAAALYRRAAVLEVGKFDEDYFCYGEDVDLGFRLRLAGHRARSVPAAIVAHVGGASGSSEAATFLGHRNLLWTVIKDTPGPLLPVALIGHLAQSILTGVFLGWRGRGGAFASGKMAALAGWKRCWQKRRVVQAGRKVSTWQIWRMIDIAPWRRGR